MNKLINICSTGRSGSTMVDLILGNDESALSLGEVYAWFRPWRTNHFELVCACGQNPCPVWDRVKDIPESRFHEQLFHLLAVESVVDSSKKLTWVIDNNIWAYKRQTYKVYNILLYKDPVSLVYSHWKRGNRNVERVLGFYDYYARFFKSGLPFVAVNYNALVQEPYAVIERLCHIVGVRFFEERLFFWKERNHHLFGSGGVKKQLMDGDSMIYKESYSEDFLQYQPAIEKKIQAGNRLQAVLSQLSAADVMKMDLYPEGANRVRKDFLYFRDKLVEKYKKRFPNTFDPPRIKSVS